MPTLSEDKEIIDYICKNYDPDQVYDMHDLIDCVASILDIDKVFTKKQINRWLKKNNYVQIQEDKEDKEYFIYY